jgi:Zn-dependent protease
MNRRLRFGRIFGVEVFLDWSWIFAFALAVWTLVSLNRRILPDLDTAPLAVATIATVAGLFASLGAHELVRVRATRAKGVPIRRLTLFVIGGVTDVERAPASPRTEAVGALAAPAASLGIALVLACGVALASAPLPRGLDDLDRLGAPGVVLFEIAAANVLVAAVNLLPAYPLDGGRLLRAAVWSLTGNVERATRIAAWSGQVVGFSLVLVGVGLTLLSGRGPGVGVGVWSAFAGWFIASAAAQGYEGVVAQRRT